MARTLTEQQYEQLSAYIDEQLSEAERLQLEQQLSTDADLRDELQSLRQTVALIQQVPLLKSPRNFTITTEMIALSPKVIPFPWRQQRAISILSGIAAVFLVVFGFVLVYTEFSSDGLSTTRRENAAQEVASAPTQATLLATETVSPVQQSQTDLADDTELSMENEGLTQTNADSTALMEADAVAEIAEADINVAPEEEQFQFGESMQEEPQANMSDVATESTADREAAQELDESFNQDANDGLGQAGSAGGTALYAPPPAPQNAPVPSSASPMLEGADMDDFAMTSPTDSSADRNDNGVTDTQAFSSEPATAPNARMVEPTILSQTNTVGALDGGQETAATDAIVGQVGDESSEFRDLALTTSPPDSETADPRLRATEESIEPGIPAEKSTVIEDSPSLSILAIGAILIFVGGAIFANILRQSR